MTAEADAPTMDNEGLLQFIKTVVMDAVDKTENGLDPVQTLKLYQETLQAIYEEIRNWQTTGQQGQSISQAFAMINNQYPLSLATFYTKLMDECFDPAQALALTRDLLALLLGRKKE